jgi:hypothetical protein
MFTDVSLWHQYRRNRKNEHPRPESESGNMRLPVAIMILSE